MEIGPGSQVVVVIRWSENSDFREQAYGPITLGEAVEEHWPQVIATMDRWKEQHPNVPWSNSTLYMMEPPGPAPEPVTP